MTKKYENILLEETSNEKIKDLEGKIGILEVPPKTETVVFKTKNQKVEISIISCIGDFSEPDCNEMWIRDSENFADYTFVKTDNFETLIESEE